MIERDGYSHIVEFGITNQTSRTAKLCRSSTGKLHSYIYTWHPIT